MFSRRVILVYGVMFVLIGLTLFLLYDSTRPLGQQTDIVQRWAENFCRGVQGIDAQLDILYIPTSKVFYDETSKALVTEEKTAEEMAQSRAELRADYEQLLSQYQNGSNCTFDIIFLSKRIQQAGWFAYPDVAGITYVDITLSWENPQGQKYQETRTVQVYRLKSGEEKIWPEFHLPTGQVIYPMGTLIDLVDESFFTIGKFKVVAATAYKSQDSIVVGIQLFAQTMASSWVGSQVRLYSSRVLQGTLVRTEALPIELEAELLPQYRLHFAKPRGERVESKLGGYSNWYWFKFNDPDDLNPATLYAGFQASTSNVDAAPASNSYVILPDDTPLFTKGDLYQQYIEDLIPIRDFQHLTDRDDITRNEQNLITAQSWYFTGLIDTSNLPEPRIEINCNNFTLHINGNFDGTMWLKPAICDLSGIYSRNTATRRFTIRFTHESNGDSTPLIPAHASYQIEINGIPYQVRLWTQNEDSS